MRFADKTSSPLHLLCSCTNFAIFSRKKLRSGENIKLIVPYPQVQQPKVQLPSRTISASSDSNLFTTN